MSGEMSEIACGLAIRAAIEASHEVDQVSAGSAASEAIPEVFGAMDDKGARIIAPMEGTGPDQAVAPRGELVDEAGGQEDMVEGDGPFEVVEVERDLRHRSPPVEVSARVEKEREETSSEIVQD